MRICALTCAAVLAAVPASPQVAAFEIELSPGHPVYHESEKEAGVAMALTIAPDHDQATKPAELCEELRVAAGLAPENEDGLRLETIFVVPYKAMAVEGYYLPSDGSFGNRALVPGSGIERKTLDAIVARAGIPPRVLDETDVEHEISCQTDQPIWHVVWQDVQLIGGEEPGKVIERAYARFMAVHQSVVEHNAKPKGHVSPLMDESMSTTGSSIGRAHQASLRGRGLQTW